MAETYDFQAAVAAANAVVNQSQEFEKKVYRYPLVYPQAGQTMVIRLLFNPASSQIVRLVNRHERIPCYRTYGMECPICKVMQQVKDATGQDPFGRKQASKARGVSFAQFISSTAPISKGEGRGNIQPGEIITFMYPWSVYTQINALIQAIAQTPTGMDQAFCHANSGAYIQISVTNDFKYTTTSVPYMTFPTGQTDEQFMEMLNGMESLNDEIIPATVTPEVDKQVAEYADVIYKQFIAPKVPNMGTAAAPIAIPGVVDPNTPITTGTPVPNMGNTVAAPANSTPKCFGQHLTNSPQCICCPSEIQCMQNSKG